MRKIIDFLRSKDPICVGIKCLLVLVLLVAICANPYSRMGKKSLIFLIIAIPINIIAQIIIYITFASLVFLVMCQMLSENNKTRRIFCYVILSAFSVFLLYISLTDRYHGVSGYTIPSDFQEWTNAIYDLKNDNTELLEDVEISLFGFPGTFNHSAYGSTGKSAIHYISVYRNNNNNNEFISTFYVSRIDFSELGELSTKYKRFNIEYYKKTHYIKSIEPIESSFGSEQAPENAGTVTAEPPPVPDTVELWLEGSRYDDTIILVYRPEIEGYDDYNKNISDDNYKRKLYWYVTKNGEYYKCLDAYKGSCSTTFLSFERSGEYTVTLVINYNESTGEYTPISNTLEYTIE